MRLFTFVLLLSPLAGPALAQQTLSGTFSGTFNTTCNGAAVSGTFSTTVSLSVQPSLTSLSSSGGSFTGTLSGSGTDQDPCFTSGQITLSGTASGTVSSGGAVSVTFTGTVNNGAAFNMFTGSGSGTSTSLTGQITLENQPAPGMIGQTGSGTISLSSGASGATLSGSYTGSGTPYCDASNTTTGQESVSGSLTATTQPALSSLAASGGQFTGTLSGSATIVLNCTETETVGQTVNGTLSGTVSPGGAVSWNFQVNVTYSDGGTGSYAGSGGTGNTSTLTYSGPLFEQSDNAPSPGTLSVVLSAPTSSGSGSGSQPPTLTIPGGGGSSQITLPGASAGVAYSQTLTATGGTAPYAWTLTGGSLPPGLSLASNGFLTGTPTQSGGSLFTARVKDSTGAFASSLFALTVAPQSLSLTTTSLPNGIVGTPYPPQVLTASGGTPPYTFQLSGSPAAGTGISSGVISGTPAAAGTFTIPVTVTDSSSPALTSSGQISFTVNPAGTNLVLSQSAVTFNLPVGASVLPAAARVNVQSSSPTQPLDFTTVVTPNVSWLSVQNNAMTPGSISLSLTQQAFSLTASAQASVVVSCAQTSPCGGTSQTITVALNISNAAPQLVITTPSLSFNVSTGSAPVSQSLGLQNPGAGSVYINSLSAADSYVTIAGNPGSVEGGPPNYLTITVNPSQLSAGFHQSSVSIVTSVGTFTVPVTIQVSANPTITLNPAGTVFNAVAGSLPGNPNGSFEVSVAGSGTVSWTATVLPGANWLTLDTASGTSTAANPGSVTFTVNSGLAAGTYYAAIQVTAPNVADSPQTYILVLNVVSVTSGLTPLPQPAGLLFIANSATTPSQTVQVFAGTSTPVPFAAAPDSSFLSVTPESGAVSSTSPATTTVSVNLQGLQPGVYSGGVNYAFSGAAVRTVNVTLIVESGAVPAADRPGPKPAASGSCTPAHLVPVENGLVNSFSQPTAWPTPLSILLANDCGQPVTNGQVVATFSNGDPPLILPAADTATGTYAATWTPRNTAQQIAITVNASAPNFPLASTQISGQVTPNVAPLLFANGTLNAFAISAEPGVPLAPGTFVQIYGSNLASQPTAPSTIPLPTSVNQTSVIIGGIPAPLYYVSPGQINAQVPFELASGNSYQIVVDANGALSTPYPIQLVQDSPGIAQYPGGDIKAEHLDGSLVTEASPAKPGEYLQIFLVGMGLTNQTVASGTASPSATLADTLDAPTITLNGTPISPASILFSGLTPTVVGLYQVDFQVPAAAPNGDLPLVLTQSSGVSNSTVLPVHN